MLTISLRLCCWLMPKSSSAIPRCNEWRVYFGQCLGMIVNGHVPVKVEKGESPLKRSGKAVTIDGAFSEAYGDHGFTLVLEPLRTYIATHHHFESVEAAIERGDDIVPTRTVVREWEEPRRVADSQRGRVLGFAMERLERLIEAYWWPTIVFTIGITGRPCRH